MTTAPLHFTASRGLRALEVGLWFGAGLVTLSLYAGVGIWLMREPPMVPSDGSPPVAIMIEFADEPEAEETEEDEISPDNQDSQDLEPVEEIEAPDEEVEPEEPIEEEPEPIEEEPEPVEEEIVEEVAELDTIEVPLPLAKPKPPKKPEPVKQEVAKKPEPKKKEPPKKQSQQAQAETKAAVKAKAQAKQSTKTAAKQTTSGRSSAQSPAKWRSKLMAHLERHKPKKQREKGTVYVRFSIDDAGNVSSVTLSRSSGSPELDNAALAAVKSASPVPAPPSDANKDITAPMKFN